MRQQKTIKTIEFAAKREVLDYFSGAYHSIFKGKGLDIDDIREYQPGDDIRDIAWSKTATMGKPFVKHFKEDRDLTVLLLIDTSASLDFQFSGASKKEHLASLASLIIFSAMHNRDKVGALFFSSEIEKYIPPCRGDTHGVRLVSEILNRAPEHKGTDIQKALRGLCRFLKKRAIIFVISDFLSADCERDLLVAAQKHDLIAVRIMDPAERDFPLEGIIRFVDLETQEERVVEITKEFREHMAKRYEAGFRQLRESILKAKASYVELSTQNEAYATLRAFFAERKKRLFR